MKKWFIIILSLTAYAASFAQFPFSKLKLNYYTVADGLSGNDVKCIAQDHLGFIWLGTTNGLNRFDGTEFQIYKKKAGDTNSIPSNTIYRITEDTSQRLWIATGEGLCWLDLKSNKVHRLNDNALSGQIIYYVLLDGKNYLWIATKEYVHRLNLKSFSLQSFKVSGEQEYKYQPRANNLFLYGDSNLYVAGWDGLYSLNTKTGIIRHVLKTGYSIDAVNDAGNGKLWLATWGSGAFLFDINRQQVTGKIHFAKPSGKFNDYNIISDIKLIRSPDGNKYNWVSGNHGILVYNPETGLLRTTLSIFTRQMFNDKDGNLWVYSEKGFCRIDLNQRFYDYEPAGLDLQTEINGVYADSASVNHLWLSLWGGGLALFDISSQKILKKYNAPRTDTINTYIFSCLPDRDNGFWIGTGLGGLQYFDLRNKKFIYFDDPFNHDPPYFNTVFKIVQAQDKKLWFACKAGLGSFDPSAKSYHYFFYYDTLKHTLVGNHRSLDVLIDKKQRLWAATQFDGCFIFDRNKSTFKKIPVLNSDHNEFKGTPVQTFAEDVSGNIWLGTTSGLFLYNERQEQFNYQNINGLPDYISAMHVDNKGNLWIFSGAQLFVYNTINKSVENYFISDGLLPEDVINVGEISNTDLMYIGYTGKFLLFRSDDLKPKQITQPVRLTRMRILDKDSSVTIASVNELMKFGYNDNDIRFDFKLLDFGNAHNTQYAFMLEGLDDKWNFGGNTNSAIYTNIPEGQYTFIVKAENSSGNWSPPFKLSYFSIATPYWHTIWFRLLVCLSVMTVIYALYRYRKRQRMQLENFRTRISSDLHDDVGSTLTTIIMMSAMAEHSGAGTNDNSETWFMRIGNNARDMMEKMRDIVWTINPSKDVVTEIITRMRQYAAQLLEPLDVSFEFLIHENVYMLKPNFLNKRNIYLIFKESLNNAAKYAQCTKTIIRLEVKSTQLEMSITDNGKGFDLNMPAEGNGLRNMKERAAQLNGKLIIDSALSKGTRITLLVPTRIRYFFWKRL